MVLGRLAWGVGLILIVTGLVFAIFELLPAGDPAMSRPGVSPEQAEAVHQAIGSDRPILVQYGEFLGDLVRLDLGNSYRDGAPVNELVAERLPATLLLIFMATIVWMILGVLAGVVASARRGGILDRVGSWVSVLLISTPVFVLGYLGLLALAAGSGSFVSLLPGIGAYAEAESFPDRVAAVLLPSLVLGLGAAGIYFRLARAAIGEELRSNYVLAARARGVGESRILWRHAFRTGLSPMLTLIGLDFALIAAGNVVLVEAVFNMPGIGGLMVSSIQDSDLPVVEALVLLTAALVVVVNIAVDVAQMLLDPRVRQGTWSENRRSRGAVPPPRDPSTSS